MNTKIFVKHKHFYKLKVSLSNPTTKNILVLCQKSVLCGRGEGLVESPRDQKNGFFLPFSSHFSVIFFPRIFGVQRGEHRGYIGAPVHTITLRAGGAHYGA